MTDQLFTATIPIFKVGGEVKGELARDLSRLEIAEDTCGLKTLQARFLAQGPRPETAEESMLYLDGKIFDFGKPVEVSVGPSGAERLLFEGALTAIEADFGEARAPEVQVFAEDRLMDLRMTRRSKTYKQVSDADLARQIGDEHGLTVEAEADGPTYDVVQQWNQSDLAFLRERARLLQAEVWISGKTLHFKDRAHRAGTSVNLVQGRDLLDLQIRADLAHQRTKVQVSGFDAKSRERIAEEAGDDVLRAEAPNGRTGPATLEKAFGERISARVREVPLAGAEARDWARAEMLRRGRAFVTASAITDGSSDLVVGTRVSFERVGQPFSGDGYYVTRVCHTYDLHHGYRTRFEAERAVVNEP